MKGAKEKEKMLEGGAGQRKGRGRGRSRSIPFPIGGRGGAEEGAGQRKA